METREPPEQQFSDRSLGRISNQAESDLPTPSVQTSEPQRLQNLKVHIRSHTGIKPFVCQCGRSFVKEWI